MKKNNTAEKSVIDAERIAKALKENTANALQSIINEAISNFVKESAKEDEAEDAEEKIDVEDVEEPVSSEETVEAPETDAEESSDAEETEDTEATEDEEDDEWSDLDDYKIGDNEYDFTGVNGDEILKIYNKLGDDDQIFVKKEEDGKYEVKDEETGAEFVIELNPDVVENAEDVDDDTDDPEIEVELDNEETPEDSEEEIEIDLNDEDEDETEEEKEENIEECNNECNTIKECGNVETETIEEGDSIATQAARKEVKTKHGQHRPNSPEQVLKVDSPLNESVKKIVEKAKAISEENKQYKACIAEIKKSLCEAAVLNVNLGKLVDILVNESATKDEKKAICKRFNNVKTINEGTELYNTIKSELNEAKQSTPILEKQFKATSTKSLNETTIYQNDNPVIDLMHRMDGLYKKNK